MKKYFHELTEKEFKKLQKTHMTWDECAKEYPQPLWCNYPDAVQGLMGCWSLMSFDKNGKNWITGRRYCQKCDLYIKRKGKKS